MKLKRILFVILLVSSLVKFSNGQGFSDVEFNTPYSDIIKSIVKVDSFYYLSGIQTNTFTVWNHDSLKYRSIILKMDQFGNILDTIYLDTLGYNRLLGNVIPQDSSFFIFYSTNPIDNKGKVSLAKYDKNFNELEYNIMDTIPPYFSDISLHIKYYLKDSNLYLYGSYNKYHGYYTPTPFILSINTKTLVINWFKVLNKSFTPGNLIIDNKNKQFSFFDLYGKIYTYDSCFINYSVDSLVYDGSSLIDYPFEGPTSYIPYHDSLYLLQATTQLLGIQWSWPGMAITITDSNFVQKETYFYTYTMDSLEYLKTPFQNGIIKSIDNSYIMCGLTCPNYGFYSKGIYVSKVDSNFNLLWEKKIENDSFPIISDMIATDDGGALVLYNYVSTEDNLNYTNKASKLIKIGPNGEVTNITDLGFNPRRAIVSIYPNPTSDKLNISLLAKNKKIDEIQIYDLQFKEILNKKINSKQTTIDVSSFAKGVYIVEGKTNTGESFWKKFVVE